jgi:hypothetical protein
MTRVRIRNTAALIGAIGIALILGGVGASTARADIFTANSTDESDEPSCVDLETGESTPGACPDMPEGTDVVEPAVCTVSPTSDDGSLIQAAYTTRTAMARARICVTVTVTFTGRQANAPAVDPKKAEPFITLLEPGKLFQNPRSTRATKLPGSYAIAILSGKLSNCKDAKPTQLGLGAQFHNELETANGVAAVGRHGFTTFAVMMTCTFTE